MNIQVDEHRDPVIDKLRRKSMPCNELKRVKYVDWNGILYFQVRGRRFLIVVFFKNHMNEVYDEC